MSDYYLPDATGKQVAKRISACKNPSLILDKYIKKATIGNNEQKGPWLRELFPAQPAVDHHVDRSLTKAAYMRWYIMITRSRNATVFDLPTDWRAVVGLGGGTVLETDITLHHLYGMPVIPGSALKGLTRAYVSSEEKAYFVPNNKGEVGPSKQEETDHPDIKRIFGTQEKAGTVIFYDALPHNGDYRFAVDIMNPHYRKYYEALNAEQKVAPDNTQAPVPIPFLTVEKTTFTFALAARAPQYQDDVTLALDWLKNALEHYGIGSKTSAGYGRFIDPQQRKRTASAITTEKAAPRPYMRPNISRFVIGQGISGKVIAPTDELRKRVPEAQAFLGYLEFAPKDVLIVVAAEEAANWETGQTKNCVFIREEERDGCTVLICRPGAAKKNKNKNKDKSKK